MGCGGFRAGGVPKALVDGKQDANALLTAIAGLAPTVADRMIYTTGVNAVNTTTLTSFARGLLDDADAATARGTLGLGSGDTPTFAGVTLLNGSNSATLEMLSGGGVQLTNVGGTGRAFDAVTTSGGEWNTEAAVGVWKLSVFGDTELEVEQGAVNVAHVLTAGLLSRTPILPLVVDQSVAGGSVSLLAGEAGCVARFANDGTGGTILLPAAPPDGWQCRIIFSGSYAGDPFTINTNSVAVYCPWYSGIDGIAGGLQVDGPSVVDFHWDNTNSRWVVAFLVGNIVMTP
jgi:hypothetical protein